MRLLFFIIVLPFLLNSQNKYPQDYFENPLDIPLVLSGTFAELRSNHFHSGLDIKTQQRVGLKIKAAADGFVSRIKISRYGYGKALYVTHPNGYTTVYAHLLKFAPEIQAFIKKHQYKKEAYEVEVFPKSQTLRVKKGSVIAYSGNSGGSGGPHLHFEIRDNAERPINPMLFGIDIKDTTKPVIKSIYAYTLNDSAFVNNSSTKQKIQLIPLKDGNYTTKEIEAYGDIGFGIQTNDRQDMAPNSNGVYNIKTFLNGSKNFELDFKRFAFSETKHINQLIDYEHFTKNRQRIQKLFKKNNPLSILKPSINNGFLSIEDSTSYIYKIKVSDYKGNVSFVNINIKGNKNSSKKTIKTIKTTPHFIKFDKATSLKKDNICVDFYKNTFYKDFYIDFKVKNDTLTLHKDIIAAKKKFNITFDVSKYNNLDRKKLYIARLIGKKKYPAYVSTKLKENLLVARTKKLGLFTIAIDSLKPTIRAKNFKNGQWLSKYRYLKVKINDKGSGISNFRATINGKWILMEYYKKTLTYDFNDSIISDTKNNLKIIVTDNVGNNSTFETLFYRK